MSRDDVTTKITSDGLRYKSKIGGSPFGATSNVSIMSCIKCGQHKPRALGSFRRLLDKSHFFCGECRPIKGAEAT